MLDAKVHKGCVQSYDAVANTIALCDCGGDGPCNWKDGKRVKPVNTGAPGEEMTDAHSHGDGRV